MSKLLTREQMGLGRIPKPDPRDQKFPVRHLLQAARRPAKLYQTWGDNRWRGNQGGTPQCVGYGWAHYIEDDPILHGGPVHPIVSPQMIYTNAQLLDGFPNPHDGSSVRAGAQFLQSAGFVASYHWAFTLQDIIDAIMNIGPVVMGTDWYNDMFFPDAKRSNIIKIGGDFAGGHCYVLNSVNTYYKSFRLKNSWGSGWGNGGDAYISFDDMEKLMNDGAEACIAIEIPKNIPIPDPNPQPQPNNPNPPVVQFGG
jgi:hypothetical protein